MIFCISFCNSNAHKPGATIEGKRADARHTGRDCHARKVGATTESPRADACHTVRDCHARKPGAIIEGIRRNCLYSIRDYNGCGKFIVYIQLLVACTIFHQIVQSWNITPCRYIRDIYVLKAVATREGTLADARHAVTDCHARKPGAIIEGIWIDFSYIRR